MFIVHLSGREVGSYQLSFLCSPVQAPLALPARTRVRSKQPFDRFVSSIHQRV